MGLVFFVDALWKSDIAFILSQFFHGFKFFWNCIRVRCVRLLSTLYRPKQYNARKFIHIRSSSLMLIFEQNWHVLFHDYIWIFFVLYSCIFAEYQPTRRDQHRNPNRYVSIVTFQLQWIHSMRPCYTNYLFTTSFPALALPHLNQRASGLRNMPNSHRLSIVHMVEATIVNAPCKASNRCLLQTCVGSHVVLVCFRFSQEEIP